MSTTGWTGLDGETPLLPQANLLAGLREPGAGDALALALGRSQAAEARQARTEAADAPDPDERAANLLARGVAPGQITDLGQRLADVEAELAAEQEKIGRSARRQARIAREQAAGRLSAFDIAAMPDVDEGDAHRAEQLERRAGRLRQQLAEAQGRVAPQQERLADPLEQATSRAHAAFVEATRAKMAAAEAGRPVVRPKSGSVSRGAAVPDEVTCPECAEVGATPEQSFLIHADPDAPAGVSLPAAELTDADLAE